MEKEKHIKNLRVKGFSTFVNVLSDKEIDFFKKNIGSKAIDKMSRKEKVFLKKNDSFFKKLKYFFLKKKNL